MKSKSLFTKNTIALAVAAFAAVAVYAGTPDIFDPGNNMLTLQSVSVGSQNFYNANVKVGSYSQLSVGGGAPVSDSFDTSNNMLTMGAVSVGGQTYNNVRVRIDSYSVVSVGQPTPGGVGSYVGPQGIFDVPNATFEPIVTILETGEVYGIDLIDGQVAGFFHGSVDGSATQISSAGLTEYNALDGGLIQQASMTATYTAPAITVSLKFPFGVFVGHADRQKGYSAVDVRSIYDNPTPLASLAAVNYQGQMSTVGTSMARYNTIAAMSLLPDGSFSAQTGGCSFNGKVVPHGQKGVFDANANVTGVGCLLAGDMKGIVVPIAISGGVKTLAFELLKQDGSSSAVLYVDGM